MIDTIKCLNSCDNTAKAMVNRRLDSYTDIDAKMRVEQKYL